MRFTSNDNKSIIENMIFFNNRRMTHQPRVIFDQENKKRTQMFWDANGNLSQISLCNDGFVRFHDWDDENRLRLVLDTANAGFYGYDANGARVYKLTGTSTITHIGNDLSSAYVKLDTAILYPNPYVTITPKEYTKHYYANEERLATSIGQGGWCHLSPDAIDEPKTDHELYLLQEWKKIYDEKEYPFEYLQEDRPVLTENEDISGNDYDELQYTCPMRRLTNIQLEYTSDNLLWPVMHDNCDAQSAELDIFYRHSDHLGSASWITSYDSKPVQYLHYMPYGQLLANQMPYGYDEQYKFTGKERDAETGYDYFGARFYAPSLLHWITVDPLADKYPGISPYAYCSWNPINAVDPDGKEWKDVDGNAITDHSKIQAYIYYNPEDFKSQAYNRAIQLEMKYGKGSVAMSDVMTKEEFATDWKSMSSNNILEVDIDHHGSNQAIHLDWQNKHYITSTGTGKTQSGVTATNVSDLGTPTGDISKAILYLNTCHSNNTGSWLGNIRIKGQRIYGTSGTLVGTRETLMQSFWNNFNFNSIRGTSAGVSYDRYMQPEPQFFFQSWTYFNRH